MRTFICAAIAAVLTVVCVAGPASAATTSTTIVGQASNATTTLSGHVLDPRGNGLAGASVTATGAGKTFSATTSGTGAFSLTVVAGIYTVVVNKGGFQSAQNDDIVVSDGSAIALTIPMAESNLSSLRVIGRTSTTVNKTPFNVSETAVSSLPPQEISLRQNNNLTDIVANLPGVTATRTFSSTPNTNFAVRGFALQTRTTVDGHPVSSGISGEWNTNYALASIFSDAEVVKGAGLNGALAGESAVGTVNLRTRDFSAKNTAGLTIGDDGWNGQFYNAYADVNFLANNRASLIVQKGYQGFNGPWNNYFGNRTGVSAGVPVGTGNPQTFNGLEQWQGDFSNRYDLAGELVKARYRFSEQSSVTLEYLGLQGQYQPQGGSYGTFNGHEVVQACQNGTTFQSSLAGCTASSTYTAPYTFGNIGQTVNAYTWFPNSFIQNNEPTFAAEFRTSIKNDTVIFRPYTHLINRFISGANENQYPGNGGAWYAVTNAANCQPQFFMPGKPGAPTAAKGGGAAGPCFTSNLNPTSPSYVGPNPTQKVVFPTTSTAPTCSPTPPYTCFTTPTGIQNNGAYGYSTPFSQPELDRLNGYTFQYVHPVNDNVYNFSYDYRKDYTQSSSGDTTPPAPGCEYVVGSANGKNVFNSAGAPYQPNCSIANTPLTNPASIYNLLPRSPIGTPPTVSQYGDFALTGTFQLSQRLKLALGNYFEIYQVNAQIEDPAVLAKYAALGNAAAAPVALVSRVNNYSHYDPHIGFEFRANPTLSFRLNGGSSITQPYPSIVSGFGSITLPNAANGQNYTSSIPNFNLKPESTVAYNAGLDQRLPNGAVVSADVYDITVHDVFLSQTQALPPITGIIANNFLQTNVVNGPIQRSYGIELTVLKNPTIGYGYFMTGSLNRTYYDQLPLSLYSGNTAPNNVNFNISGSQIFGDPFFKSYGQVFYNGPRGYQFEVGADFEGQDNSTFGPSYTVFDTALRAPIRNAHTHLQVSIQNMFNYSVGNALGRTLGNQGNIEPGVYLSKGQLIYAGGVNPTTGGPNTSVASPLEALPPRTLRFSLQFDL